MKDTDWEWWERLADDAVDDWGADFQAWEKVMQKRAMEGSDHLSDLWDTVCDDIHLKVELYSEMRSLRDWAKGNG